MMMRGILAHKQYKQFVVPAGAAILCAAGVAIGVFFIAPAFGKGTAQYMKPITEAIAHIPIIPHITHVDMPEHVRAIYMSQCAASSNAFRKELTELIAETEINSIIIDVKDFSGTVSFSRDESSAEVLAGTGCTVPDMKEFIDALHADGVYVIGRITVFQDPLYTKVHPEFAVQSKSHDTPWKDYKGLSFVDVGARPFWDYIVAIAHESRDIGFDELNFDYVRFPSDGPMSDVEFDYSDYTQRALELEKFFRYLAEKVRHPDATGHVPMLSADLFGMTTTNMDDLTIGQVLERATPYFDFIAPMTYPSHYPPGFNGYSNPNNNVYGVIKYSLDKAAVRVESATTTIAALPYTRIGTSTPAIYSKPARARSVIRPWLQDFDYGGDYGPEEVRAQIQAAYDAGMHSWMLWAPSNHYTRGGLQSTGD